MGEKILFTAKVARIAKSFLAPNKANKYEQISSALLSLKQNSFFLSTSKEKEGDKRVEFVTNKEDNI